MKATTTALLLPLALFLTACPEDVNDRAAPGDPSPAADANGEVAVCLEGEEWVGDGQLHVEQAGAADADSVRALRWEAHEGCERFVIDLADAEGNPAEGAGDVSVEVLRDLGVVRVTLRDVEWVAQDATEESFEGELARGAYTVWADEGRWVFVDLHLAGEAEAHAAVLDDPARVVVDLRPGGGPIPELSAIDQGVVVLAPRPGAASYPLTVTGYARTFEANVVARIEQDGEEVDLDFTTATAWADAWGYYSITFEDGPSGPIELHVGEHSARDGTWQGTMVGLEMN